MGPGRPPDIQAHVLSSQRQSSPGLPLPSRATGCPDIFFISNEDRKSLMATNGVVRTFHTLLLLRSIHTDTDGCYLLSIYYVPDTALGGIFKDNIYNIDKGPEAWMV